MKLYFMLFKIFLLCLVDVTCALELLETLRLTNEHIPFFLDKNPLYRDYCMKDEKCASEFQDVLSSKPKCWGYEKNCDSYTKPVCPDTAKGWVRDKKTQVEHFWNQADFGYIKDKLDQLQTYCTPQTDAGSSLECVDHLRFCRAKNLFMDFSKAEIMKSNSRYREDVFDTGTIGGFCSFKNDLFHKEGDHKSALQSWYGELQNFQSLSKAPISGGMCDIVVDKPTFLMKLDAGVNMYHHFCDFMNLYMSQHINNSFGMDVQIVMWDTSYMHYGDFFHDTWKAFTTNPIIPLRDWDGKKVCVRDAVFPLLPRMRYGHFYNMPLIPGCEKSSMYKAFSHHMVHRLNLTQEGPLKDKIRVTLLSRSSKYRRILNQDQLVKALMKIEGYEVRVVDFSHKIPFLEQIQISHNSDIFMGIHGAGLTHMLFQPDWGVIFEIYNCDDQNCYKDLGRLRGLKYMTWENIDKLDQEDEGHHPTLGAHKKFTNYSFQVSEFLRLIRTAAEYVRSHPTFVAQHKQLYSSGGNDKDEL